MPRIRRPSHRTLGTGVAVLAALLIGCGDDDANVRITRPLDERAARLALEGAGLDVTWTGRTTAPGGIRPAPVQVRELDVRGGRRVELLVFADSAAAQRARQTVASIDAVQQGATVARGRNVIAVTSARASDEVRRRVTRAMLGLSGHTPSTSRTVPLDDVTANPTAYLDRRVTVRGHVIKLLPSDARRPQARATDTVTFVGRVTKELPDGWTAERSALSPETGMPALVASRIGVAR